MPLKEGKQNEGENIKELYEANKSKPEGKKRPRAQIIAIALRAAGAPPPKNKKKED